MADKFTRPLDDSDVLYEAYYDHPEGNPTCSKCVADKQIPRTRTSRTANHSIAHYGLIASANQVMRHGATREKLRQEVRPICFDMEAAGLMDGFRCLVIRGICDYADSHKNKIWQPYSALAAACYAKELLYTIPGRRVTATGMVAEAVDYPGSPPLAGNLGVLNPPRSFEYQHTPADESTSSANSRRRQVNESFTFQNGNGVPRRPHLDIAREPETTISQSLDAHQANRNPSMVERGLQQNLKEFRMSVTTQQRTILNKATLNDLRMALLHIEREQARKSKLMNLPRVEAFLQRVKQLSTSSTLDTSESCTYIWASVKFILQATANSPIAFDSILDAYEQMAVSMTPEDEDFASWCSCPQKDEILATIHGNIMQFHRHVLSFLRIPPWRQVFGSLWRGFSQHLEHLVRDLQRIQQLVKDRATAAEFHEYNVARQLAHRALEQAQDEERKARSAAILQWLAGADSQLDHEILHKTRQDFPCSGRWFFKHPNFRCWRQDDIPKKPGLWLVGIPGAGKTILASSVIEDCQQDQSAQTVYFYCKHGDPQRTTLMPILRSILRQLIRPSDQLLSWCYDQYLSSNQLSLSSEKTCREMLRTLLLSTERSFVIVDGIDECEQHERDLLLSFLSGIISECDSQHPGKLRVMVVSRDEPDVRRKLSGFSEIAIRPNDNEEDIRNFIGHWREKLQDRFEELDEADLDYICTSTLNRADGMFLFAKLVMTNLCQQINLESLQRYISPDNFPKGLEQAYARILDRISSDGDQAKVAMAQKVLAWMTCARRPLKWHEIQGALSIQPGDGSVDFAQRRARTHIREICGSLINDLSGDRLELVHSTAKDFLVRSAFVAPHDTECYLASLCLTYLTSECFDGDLDESKRAHCLVQGSFAFQDYAVTHWSDHVSAAIKAGPIASSRSREALEDTPDLGSAVTNFVAHYQLRQRDHNESSGSGQASSLFSECSNFDDICAIFEDVQSQRTKGVGFFDEINPKALEPAVTSSRAILEGYARKPDIDARLQKTLIMKYGPKWFKCPKTACYYFHEGFGDLKSQKYHITRHEQPFRCGNTDCERGYKLGFTTQRDLEKHMSIYHPESGTIVATFTRLKRRREESEDSCSQSPKRAKAPAAFACEQCPKSFTRQSSLNSHVVAEHTKTKPFKCSHCEQHFARDNDRKRHEKIHSGVKEYVCRGQLKWGIPGSNFWGCGKPFPRLDALKSHYRTEAGRICLKPLHEEEQRLQQLNLQIQQRKAAGLELPLPQGLVELYPELQDSDSNDVDASAQRPEVSGPNNSQSKVRWPFRGNALAGY
ncbi:hypothetical protein LTR20_001091 [Exophiala xenobiotica]|nr:hypothetical protein LTS06_011304 [Exophiala xenobiotica]KAK5374800.1 hypothetical protein LTS13_005368 [Exophiala xenobiotica]KAK5396950.1 hypothetical protein LTR79_005586 [Exophiala xenobiotica]KAK5470830.1 hypothetical protein LTR20_001091 [Exophiala xenobiotica]KAK5502326.1 hypothetical protein LTR83_002420 [Exophiala xenobiotica]